MAIEAEQRYYLKLKAAHYYYEKDMTQAEIAAMLNISRITLGRLLREAKEEGMVKIEIMDHRNIRHCLDAEEELRSRFGLLDAKVVDCLFESDADTVNRQIALRAARYVEQLLQNGMRIAIGWGRTLEIMTQNLHKDKSITGLELVTLLGGASTVFSMIQPNILAQTFLEKYQGCGYILNAPYICQTEALCKSMKAEPGIADALRRSLDADITLIGIGEKPVVSERYRAYYNYDAGTIRMLQESGAVGDICAHFFDAEGKLCKTAVCRRVISIDPTDLKQHKKVIMIGGGENKHEGVLGALRGGYPHVLITDYTTARAVLDKM